MEHPAGRSKPGPPVLPNITPREIPGEAHEKGTCSAILRSVDLLGFRAVRLDGAGRGDRTDPFRGGRRDQPGGRLANQQVLPGEVEPLVDRQRRREEVVRWRRPAVAAGARRSREAGRRGARAALGGQRSQAGQILRNHRGRQPSDGISLDGKNWQKIDGSQRNLGLLEVGESGFELWVDDRYVSTKSPGSCYYDYLEFTPFRTRIANRRWKVLPRRVSKSPMGRGIVTLPKADGTIYVGWRLLKDDPEGVAFNVHRRTGPEGSVKLTATPLSQTTDFVDEHPVAGVQNFYVIVPVVDGKEGQHSAIASATPSSKGKDYVSIELDGDHKFQKCGIADLTATAFTTT